MRDFNTPLNASRVPFMLVLLASLMMTVFFFTGCEENPTESEDFDPVPTLYSFIETGAPVDTVNLLWTGTYGAYYDPANLGIEDAYIVMYPVLDENGDSLNSIDNPDFQVLYFDGAPGRENYGEYVPTTADYRPVGRWTYRLEARKKSEGVDLWAETCAPDTFNFFAAARSNPFTPVAIDGDTLTREDDEIFINWTESAEAQGFVLGIIAETPRDHLIPLDPDWDPNDPDDELEPADLQRHNWTIARYDQRSMTIGWIFFQWSGWNRLYISAASPDYFDYMYTLLQEQNPSWKNNPTYNVRGGLGVFGATYTHEFNIFLERVEQ